VLTDTNEVLLNNLKLTDNGYLKRAALLLFHPDPEKFVSGAYIKIGFFRTDSDLLFQDEIHGNLFEQVEKTMDLLFTKYIRAMISYEDIYRVETYEYPKDALREALLNAVAHKDYTGPYPIQISVYDNKIMIWNYGKLPENWTVEDLLNKHSSQPRNPDIATTFFRSGYVESWGRGMDKMRNLCIEAKIPLPQLSCKGNDFWTVFRKDIYNKEDLSKLGLSDRQIKAVLYVKEHGKITNKEYQEINTISKRTAAYELVELTEKYKLFKQLGASVGTYYEME
jgi:ATP-dependent DNA helicase RecG